MKTFEEIGKGLIALANILLVLVFIRDFAISHNVNSIMYGLISWFSLYIFGSLFIYISELLQEDKK